MCAPQTRIGTRSTMATPSGSDQRPRTFETGSAPPKKMAAIAASGESSPAAVRCDAASLPTQRMR